MDGVVSKNKKASCGGLIRDNNGDWLRGFTKYTGTCKIIMEELLCVYKGLNLAKNKGYTKVEL